MSSRKQLLSGHIALRKGRFSNPAQHYLLTAVSHQRQPCFADFHAACAAARCFEDPAIIGSSSMICWVLMPDHAHWLIALGNETLADLVNRLKSSSARHANKITGNTGPLWAKAFHDRALRHDDDLLQAVRYIVGNPVRAGLASNIGEYSFWNAHMSRAWPAPTSRGNVM